MPELAEGGRPQSLREFRLSQRKENRTGMEAIGGQLASFHEALQPVRSINRGIADLIINTGINVTTAKVDVNELFSGGIGSFGREKVKEGYDSLIGNAGSIIDQYLDTDTSASGYPRDPGVARQLRSSLDGIRSALPFEATISGKDTKFLVTGFNSRAEIEKLGTDLKNLIGALETVRGEFRRDAVEQSLERIWGDQDLDKYAKMALQLSVDQDDLTLRTSDGIAQAAVTIEDIDSRLLQSKGSIVLVDTGEYRGVVKSAGEGLHIEPPDSSDKHAELSIAGMIPTQPGEINAAEEESMNYSGREVTRIHSREGLTLPNNANIAKLFEDPHFSGGIGIYIGDYGISSRLNSQPNFQDAALTALLFEKIGIQTGTFIDRYCQTPFSKEIPRYIADARRMIGRE